MSIEAWLTFLAASLVLTVTPGPSIFLGIVHAINYGPRKTLYTAAGDISANFIQMVLVSVGLGIVISNSEFAFQIIKWIGVATLFYLGIKLLWSSSPSRLIRVSTGKTCSNTRLFFSGFMVAASNPKAIVFFTALFPQFIDPTQPLLKQMIIMCPTMALLDFTLIMLYAISSTKVIHSTRFKLATINKVGGGALVSSSAVLAFTNR